MRQYPLISVHVEKQLSYRKQIARQLRTQYVEGIHRPKYYTVTKEWPDLEIWVWGPSRSLRMARFNRPCMTLY